MSRLQGHAVGPPDLCVLVFFLCDPGQEEITPALASS